MALLRSPTFHFLIKPEIQENTENFIECSCTSLQVFSTSSEELSPLALSLCTKSLDNLKIPQVFPERFLHLKETFLGTGYKRAKFISPEHAKPYNQSVVNRQLKLLREIKDQSADFICLGVEGGRLISQQLITWLHPRISKEWQFCAMKAKDSNCIYLWHEANDDITSHTPEAYYLHYFRALLTSSKPMTLKQQLSRIKINEYERSFSFNKLQIGRYRVLLPVEIDAIHGQSESANELIGIRLHKEFSPIPMQRKRLSYWAEWIVSGWESLLIGQRDYRGLVQDIEVLKYKEELLQGAKVSGNDCLHRQEEFLSWIKLQLMGTEGVVFNFSWTPSDWIFSDRVICSQSMNKNLETPLSQWGINDTDLNNNSNIIDKH